MFALGTAELLVVAIALLLEVALFWAASALGDAPPLAWGKTFLVVLGVTLVWVVALAGICASTGLTPDTLLRGRNWSSIGLFALITTGVTWMVPAVLYVPLLTVSVPRSMLISVFQVLLRAFLYVLLAAIVMVVLALVQIWTGTDVRTDLGPPVHSALATLGTP